MGQAIDRASAPLKRHPALALIVELFFLVELKLMVEVRIKTKFEFAEKQQEPLPKLHVKKFQFCYLICHLAVARFRISPAAEAIHFSFISFLSISSTHRGNKLIAAERENVYIYYP